jgi:hypothetical protein
MEANNKMNLHTPITSDLILSVGYPVLIEFCVALLVVLLSVGYLVANRKHY